MACDPGQDDSEEVQGVEMKITVNGEERMITAMSVEEYLQSIECDPMPVAVELNRSLLRRSEYGSAVLAEGDRLDIIWFVGGG